MERAISSDPSVDMNDFLSAVGEALSTRIAEDGIAPAAGGTVRHWVVLQDDTGTTLTEDDESGLEPHEIVGSLIAGPGVRGAAYVTQHDGDALVAMALVRNPGYGVNSDIRRSDIRREHDHVSVAEWRYAV
jgi:hypothetical protein